MVIELDFKQKIAIGLGPRQVNKENYNQVQRCVLGFGIYYYNQMEDKIMLLNVDVIGDANMSQDALSVVKSFRMMREQNFLRK